MEQLVSMVKDLLARTQALSEELGRVQAREEYYENKCKELKNKCEELENKLKEGEENESN